MKSEKYVKTYFKKSGTVAKWWNPTKDDYSHIYEKQLEIVKSWLKKIKPENSLEISCGKGRATKQLSKLGRNYLATDISKEMINIAKRTCKGVTFRQEDAEKLSIKTGTQDCIICLEALVHYPNPEKAIKEFYRVLKNGGVLIIDSDNSYSLRRILKNIFKFIDKKNYNSVGEDIFKSYNKKELCSMIKRAGFKIERFLYLGTLAPIRIKRNKGNINILSKKISKILQFFPADKIPIIQRLATYHLILARK